MQLHNNYYFYKSVIDKKTCERIIETGMSEIEKYKKLNIPTHATTFGNVDKASRPDAVPQNDKTYEEIKKLNLNLEQTYVRDSEVSWLSQTWIYDIILKYVYEANKLAGWNWQIDFSEPCQFTIYKPGGFYGWHRDGASDNIGKNKRFIYGVTDKKIIDDKIPEGYTTNPNFVGKVRKISMTLNLNSPEEYEGGELKFDFGPHKGESDRFHLCEEIKPQGSLIVFPSFLYHCVTPVTKGTRYSLVCWTLGEPFK
jgi:PKHD-type hydroxylase